MTNTSREITEYTEKHQHETISIIDRMQIAHKLTSIKIEIDAIIRILNDNNKKVKTTQLEQLILRQSELLDAALNRRQE